MKESIKERFINLEEEDFSFFTNKGERNEKLYVSAHWHDECELVFCNGYGKVSVNGKKFSYGCGDIIFIPSQFLHNYEEEIQGDYQIIIVSTKNIRFLSLNSVTKSFDKLINGKFANPVVFQSIEISRIFKLTAEAITNKKLLLARANFLEFLSMLEPYLSNSEENYKHAAIIKEAIIYFEKNYSSQISLEKLCSYLDTKKFYFIKVFKQYCGVTPVNFLLNMRLEKAEELLLGGTNVTQASLSCGFSNLSYFIKKYRQKYGNSPKRHIKSMKL